MDSNVKSWFVSVTPTVVLLHFTAPGRKGCRNSETVQTERFEDTIPMDNQSNNIDFCEDLEKWLRLPMQDEPLGELATNGGGFESIEKPSNVWQLEPETESECMAIRIVGETWVAR